MSFNNPIKKFYVGNPGGGFIPSPSPSKTPSITPSISVSPSFMTSVTPTPSITTPLLTPSATPSISVTPSVTPSITNTPSITPTPSPSVNCTKFGLFDQMQQASLQFMQTTIAYYVINLNQTKTNIYGESLEKWYYEPFLIKCIIERNQDTTKDEMFGPDIEKNITLTIPKIAWEDTYSGLIQGVNSMPVIGDIIFDRSTERYFEINNVIVNYIPISSNINVGHINCPQADLVTYNIECHQTRISKLNLLPYKLL
jgi:hypothetical protein